MGLIVLPFLFVAVFLGIIAIVKTVIFIKSEKIDLKQILFGLLTSIVIFGLICLSYKIQGKAWGVSPLFRIPIFMVFIPLFWHFVTEKFEILGLTYVSGILLASVSISTILGVIFNKYIFNLVEILGIRNLI